MNLGFLKQSTEQRSGLIVSGSIPKTILLLSIPSLMMGVVQSAIPLIDGLFINNIAGTACASAITYCTPIVGIIVGLAAGLGAAGMAMIGQANGKGNFEEGRRIAAQLVVFASLLGVVLAPALYIFAYPISSGVTPEISDGVFRYLTLNTLVIPFSFLESIYNAIKNANGKPEATFVRMVILLILKVAFNALFIAVFRWEITGAAMSSLASNLIITVWMYLELFVKNGSDRLNLRGFRFDRRVIRNLVLIGLPAMAANVMIYAGFVFINNDVQKYGAVVLNGQGIAGNITTICFILPSSFASAVTTMVSMNVGAGNSARARAACWTGCLMSAVSAVLMIALVVPLSEHITVLFTREREVLDVANRALHIYTYSVVGFGLVAVQLGAFTGLGRTFITLWVSVLRIWLLRVVFIIATQHLLGVDSVFWGNLFSNYTCAIITTLMILRVRWVSVINDRNGETLGGAEEANETKTI